MVTAQLQNQKQVKYPENVVTALCFTQGDGGAQKTEGSIQSSDQKHNLLNRNTEKLASQFTTH